MTKRATPSVHDGVPDGSLLACGRERHLGSTVASTLRAPNLPEGVDRAIGTAVFTTRDGPIIRLEQTYVLSDPQTATLFELSGLTTTTTKS
jgi:hypothetical protein